MAPNLAILTTLTTFALFSGCIGQDTDPSQAPAGEDFPNDLDDFEVPDNATPTPPTPATPNCNSNTNNYGFHMDLMDTVYVRAGGDGVVVYKESNGRNGLQRDANCGPTDTRIVEEDPLYAAVLASLKA